jgi:microsomal epoxide hydrolase/non-specific protein-tyrosine kinase
MPLRHPARVAGVVGVNTPHLPRAPVDPIEIFRKRFGDMMYIVQFQDPAREPDRIFGGRVAQTFDAFMRKPLPRKETEPKEPAEAGIGASRTLNLAFPQMVEAYDSKLDARTPILTEEEKQVFVETYQRTGFTGGINWYRNMTRNWQRSESLDLTVRVPSLMIMAENDAVLPPSAADGMEKLIPDLEKYLVRDSGHWTQQEQPEEVSAKLIEWRKRRFG